LRVALLISTVVISETFILEFGIYLCWLFLLLFFFWTHSGNLKNGEIFLSKLSEILVIVWNSFAEFTYNLCSLCANNRSI
jgi:hypothetical protein